MCTKQAVVIASRHLTPLFSSLRSEVLLGQEEGSRKKIAMNAEICTHLIVSSQSHLSSRKDPCSTHLIFKNLCLYVIPLLKKRMDFP